MPETPRKPHVLIAETTCFDYVERIQKLGWARMFCFRDPTIYQFEKFGLDNGAFDAWQHDTPWDSIAYEFRLRNCLDMGITPYVAVTPDIVANGCESLQFSLAWIKNLPSGWPWYLAVQDGMRLVDVEEKLHLFSGIFLGGTDKFKLSAYKWCALAHKHQKKFHYGRAGTIRKLRHAIRIGADSLDSSFMLWTKARFGEFTMHWEHEDYAAAIRSSWTGGR